MNNVVILAGGQGKRMKADAPKPLFKVIGEPMLEWVIKACNGAGLDNICVVKGYRAELIDEYLNGRYETVLQSERLGTGHAVLQAVPFLAKNLDGNTLVLCGDAPFMDSDTISGALEYHINNNCSATVITAELDSPDGYGRIVRGENGITSITEQKDATPAQLAIKEVNSGAYWFRTAELISALGKLRPNNSQGEYYLTDTIEIIIRDGKRADAYKSSGSEVVLGANDRRGMLMLNTIARNKIIEAHLEAGVEFVCTDGVIIGRDVEIEAGATILQGTELYGKTRIGSGAVIGPNSRISNCTVGRNTLLNYVQAFDSVIDSNVKIGPFVHIRPNSHICSGVKIGDFVEIKNSVIGNNTAVAHLTYVGDSDVGRNVNFGCGCVTVNYDGINKNRTVIGDNCFIGCNTNLIAPVSLGKAVYTAAGTTVARDVPDYALAIDRGRMTIKEGYSLKKLGDKAKRD